MPSWAFPSSPSLLTVASRLSLLGLPPVPLRVWSSHLFSPLHSLMSESGPMTLNTTYMLMTRNFLSLALISPLDSKLLYTTTCQISDWHIKCNLFEIQPLLLLFP